MCLVSLWRVKLALQTQATHTDYRGTRTARSRTRRIVPLLRQIWHDILEDDCIGLAAQMAYFFILSLFPFFFVLGALAGFLPYTNLWTGVSNAIVQHSPAETRALALQTILNLSHGNKTFLSLGSIGTIWAASSGIVSLMENLSRAYEVKETRGFWRKRLL